MTVRFTPLAACAETQPFAEAHGIDLARPLDPGEVARIRQGLLEHGLLLFRNQHRMTPENEAAFSKALGWHDPDQREYVFGFGAPTTEHRVSGGATLPDCPEVSVLGNVLLEDYHGLRNVQLVPVLGLSHSGWHADGVHDMFDGLPEVTTMFNPPGWQSRGGGETYFTSGVRAVERMDPELAAELERCTVAYARFPNDDARDESRRVTPGPSLMTDDGTRRIGFIDRGAPDAGLAAFELRPEHADGGGRHPAIRVHPETGQRSLYVTPAAAVVLLDTETGEIRHGMEETVELLARALIPSTRRGVRYEHRWSEGDFVAWSNTLVLHSATDAADIDGARLMHRVRLSSPKRQARAA